MSGRGRALTLPAWMTAGGSVGGNGNSVGDNGHVSSTENPHQTGSDGIKSGQLDSYPAAAAHLQVSNVAINNSSYGFTAPQANYPHNDPHSIPPGGVPVATPAFGAYTQPVSFPPPATAIGMPYWSGVGGGGALANTLPPAPIAPIVSMTHQSQAPFRPPPTAPSFPAPIAGAVRGGLVHPGTTMPPGGYNVAFNKPGYTPPGTVTPGPSPYSFPKVAQPLSSSPITSNNGGVGASSGIQDSNNDASAWSEHEAPKDKRKFWFNKLTSTSTFDKPACLKTPEERSIPPCPWTEYSTNEGKKYYVNGPQTQWEMPEEFRIWSERVAIAASKRRPQQQVAQNAPSGLGYAATDAIAADLNAPSTSLAAKPRPAVGSGKKVDTVEYNSDDDSTDGPSLTFATKEEAIEAFKKMLDDRNIGSSIKFKEAQEMCKGDKRWGALQSVGDRKQSLAEYQTKKAKLEKEEKKEKTRKNKNGFLQLLAESTSIDSSTRWRDAQRLLCTDHRYKVILDDFERQDIFDEFISELEKTEKIDKDKSRREALDSFRKLLFVLAEEKKIDRRSVWADAKPALSAALADKKYAAINEQDMRHELHDVVAKLESEYKEMQRLKRDQLRSNVDAKESKLSVLLTTLSTGSDSEKPAIQVHSKWEDIKHLIETTSEFVELNEAYAALVADDVTIRASDRGRSLSAGARAGRRQRSASDFIEECLADLEKLYRSDSRTIKSALSDVKYSLSYDTEFDEVLSILQRYALKEKDVDLKSSVTSILAKRLHHVHIYFESARKIKLEQHEEDLKAAVKLERRYIELLEDYYYRSDHVGTPWEDAKDELQNRSAYIDLNRDKRKALFEKYMSELSEKMNAKKRSQTARQAAFCSDATASASQRVLEPGEVLVEDEVARDIDIQMPKSSLSRSRSNSAESISDTDSSSSSAVSVTIAKTQTNEDPDKVAASSSKKRSVSELSPSGERKKESKKDSNKKKKKRKRSSSRHRDSHKSSKKKHKHDLDDEKDRKKKTH